MFRLFHRARGHTVKPIYKINQRVPKFYQLWKVRIDGTDKYLAFKKVGWYCSTCKKKKYIPKDFHF